MMIDRLLSAWPQLIVECEVTEPWIVWCANPDNLIRLISHAQFFNIANVDEYYAKQEVLDLAHDIPNIRPVFNVCWYEYPCTVAHSRDFLRSVGVLSFKYPDHDECNTISFGEARNGRFVVAGWAHWHFVDNALSEVWAYDIHGKPIPEIDEIMAAVSNFGLAASWLATSFMHCKNVALEDHNPTVQQQRSRERRRKPPMVTFHTLRIEPMVKILRNEGQSESRGLKYALHICRGHFKDYSNGQGLFGRNKGLYWWESHVRGDVSVGIALKDYEVVK